MKTITELMNLTGRVAMITGGAGHIGRAIAEGLAEVGANIVLVDINKESLEQAELHLKNKYCVDVLSLLVNMEDSSEIESVPLAVEQRFGRLDIIVNNAAFVGDSGLTGWVTEFESQELATWRRALEVNLTAPFSLVQSCASLLERSKSGSVINIGSIYGIVGPDLSLYENTPMGNPAAYAASKGGLTQLTRWLSTVMAPEVRVNTLTPGGVARNQPSSFTNKFIDRTPLQRMASEEDFKGAAVFLASDLSNYVTGQNIIVDGGWSIW